MDTHLQGITLNQIQLSKRNGKTAYFIESTGPAATLLKVNSSKWQLVYSGIITHHKTRRQAISHFAHYNNLPIKVKH